MRILQLCIRYPPAPGGVETHVAQLCTRLQARGHQVRVLTSDLRKEIPFERLPPTDPQWAEVSGVPVERHRGFTLGGEAHYVLLPSLGARLLQVRHWPDVVHVHVYGMSYTGAAALVGRLADWPTVFTPHYHPPWSMSGGQRRAGLRHAYDRWLGPPVLRAFDRVIVNSAQERAALQHLGLDPRRAATLTSGIDPRRFATLPPGSEARTHLGIPADAPLVLYAGRLASNKGLDTLVRATEELVADHAGLRVVLVGGDFGAAAALRHQVAAAGLARTVLLPGHLEDDRLFLSAFAACDLFVLPSEYEAFGIVLAEAMAAGKPCVATDRGGMPELVAAGRTGLLVPYADAPALAAAIDRLLRDAPLRAAMGQAGRARALELFTWERVVSGVEGQYAAAIAAHRRS